MEVNSIASLIEFLSTPTGLKVGAVFAAYYVFNSAIQALPAPEPLASSKFYHWFFQFMHGLSGNWALMLKTSRNQTRSDLAEEARMAGYESAEERQAKQREGQV